MMKESDLRRLVCSALGDLDLRAAQGHVEIQIDQKTGEFTLNVKAEMDEDYPEHMHNSDGVSRMRVDFMWMTWYGDLERGTDSATKLEPEPRVGDRPRRRRNKRST